MRTWIWADRITERVKRICQQLGISKDMPLSDGELEFDADFNVVESVKNGQELNKNNLVNTRPKVKSKTIEYSDFIRQFDKDDFIDAKIIPREMEKNLLKVRIYFV